LYRKLTQNPSIELSRRISFVFTNRLAIDPFGKFYSFFNTAGFIIKSAGMDKKSALMRI
jgi:hypothetical protein